MCVCVCEGEGVRVCLYFYSQLQRSQRRFVAFYSTQHNGRKLNWLYHLSKVQTHTTYDGTSLIRTPLGQKKVYISPHD